MIKAKKELGQNFLIDEVALNRIIELINPKNEDHFLEIGPGRGALTKRLSDKAKRLDAVELDQDLLLSLKLINSNKLFIHNESILNFDIDRIIEYEKIRLVGNLPYNISTEIILWAFDSLKQLEDMHFMFQKEFGERLSAEPNNKSYGRISVMVQSFYKVEKKMNISKNVFHPKPKIESSIIKFKKKKTKINYK